MDGSPFARPAPAPPADAAGLLEPPAGMSEAQSALWRQLAPYAIAQQTLRGARDPETFATAFESRLLALSQTHNALTDSHWAGAGLRPILLQELGDYRPDLLDRPRLRIGSRADLAEPDVLADFDGPAVSAVTGEGMASIVGALRQLVEEARAEQAPPEGFVTLRPVLEGITISRRDDGSFVVEGREALRAVNLNDLTNPDAMDVARERLDKLGVDRALGRAGADSVAAIVATSVSRLATCASSCSTVTMSQEPSRIQMTPSQPSSVTCAAEKVADRDRRCSSTDTGASGNCCSHHGSVMAAPTNRSSSTKRPNRRPPSGAAAVSAA